jgi:hypothetical protein
MANFTASGSSLNLSGIEGGLSIASGSSSFFDAIAQIPASPFLNLNIEESGIITALSDTAQYVDTYQSFTAGPVIGISGDGTEPPQIPPTGQIYPRGYY